ncbi:DNA ligase [Vibrio phage JSF28]|uniref:DNA ligase n=1 Tax=Vibrio phage JSF28 TaxID=1983606 RepID=A0A2D0YV79_9CAUD|nr:DNA ligase [Vibrio phage JSF28]
MLPLSALKASPDAEIEIPYCVMYEQVKVLMHQLWELLPEMDWKQEETYEVYDMASLEELFKKVRAEGHEGLIIKDPMTNWKRGKKTGYWKMKPEGEIDGNVVGVNWGTVGLANEGKVIGFQVLLENGVVVDANGITQEQMEEYTNLIYKTGHDDCFNGRPVQVKYMEKTPKGSLRHPSFQRWRDLEGAEGVKA